MITKNRIVNLKVRSITSLIAVSLLFFLMCGLAEASIAQFPLKVGVDKRRLEDQAGTPFLVNGTSSWALIVGLTREEADQYLEDRRIRGFNSVMVMLLARHPQTQGPSNRYGELPFEQLDDFSRPNEKYFQHVDWVINKAAEKGMLVLLAPAYLGYDCGAEGWCQQMKATPLSVLRSYGNYLGNRYKDYKNIIWLHGGDADAAAWGALDHVNAVAEGILETDMPGRINTAHCSRQNSAIDCYNERWLNLNTTYSGCQLSAAKTKNDYQRLPVFPSLYIEGVYENLGADARCLRSQAYWPVVGGLTGQVFGNDPIWKFASGWKTALDSIGSRSMTYLSNLFASRPWSLLVPDYEEKIVSGNRGIITNSDYIMAARASDGSVIIAYMPTGRTVTVDMSAVAGSAADVWWYDPENGTAHYVGEFNNSGSQNFTSPDGGDWVLVVDNADLGFAQPGEVSLLPSSFCNDGIDNDGDGLIDYPSDPGCNSTVDNDEYNAPPPAPQCADGKDNDADGFTDYPNDPGCSSASDNDEYNAPPPAAQCADGKDNDADGFTDYPNDPGCSSASDNDEYNAPPSPLAAQCADGKDNDADGLIDMADFGCSDASDSNESDDPSLSEILKRNSVNISSSSITESESGSLEPFSLLLLFYAVAALRQSIYRRKLIE